ncbi:MAG: hypothetical protein WC889_08220 [Myxococcota bacterium]
MAVLAVNDHYLKIHHPSWITGKLSDFAGMVFFPILLTATASLFLSATRRRATPAILAVACAMSGAALTAIKLSPFFRGTYLTVISGLHFTGGAHRLQVVADPTDCLALLVLPLVWLWGARRLSTVKGD